MQLYNDATSKSIISGFPAHGKRSAKPPAAAPDWFVAKLLLNMDSNGELVRVIFHLKYLST